MSYLCKFYNMKLPEKAKERESYYSELSTDLIKHAIGELRGKHRQTIEKPYFEEKVLSEWMKHVNGTIESKIFNAYFRPEIVNAHNIPANTGAMIVANHSGMFGWDGIALFHAVYKQTGRVVSMVGHHMFKNSDMVKTFGAITEEREKARKYTRKLLEEDRITMACPGGAMEVAKPFWKRYTVPAVGGFAKGKYGYLITAILAGKPIIPAGVVGAEETHIIIGDAKPYIAKAVKGIHKRLPKRIKENLGSLAYALDRTQAFPLPLNLIPFPSKIKVNVGEPIHFYNELSMMERMIIYNLNNTRNKMKKNEKRYKRYEALEEKLFLMNERTMKEIQNLLDSGRQL